MKRTPHRIRIASRAEAPAGAEIVVTHTKKTKQERLIALVPPAPPLGRKLTTADIFPRRRMQGLSIAEFGRTFAEGARARANPPARPARAIKPTDYARPVQQLNVAAAMSAFAAMIDLINLVGLPQMYAPDAKGTTLIDVNLDGRFPTVRLIHRRPHTRDLVERAGEKLEAVLSYFGVRVRNRERMACGTMIGWQAILRLDAAGGGALAL